MRSNLVLTCLLLALWPALLRAVPGSLENNDYKVNLSETLPGLDGQVQTTGLQAGPTITVDVQDKFRSADTRYPINAYAIPHYYLLGDALDLLCRTSLTGAASGPRYTFLQLNLPSTPDSRQFENIKQFSFSPDEKYLLVVFDGNGASNPIALIQLDSPPAKQAWLFTQKGRPNLFNGTGTGDIQLQDPAGWSADSNSAVFVVSTTDGSKDAQGNVVWKDFLANLQLGGDEFKVSTNPVDLSPYHFRNGSVINKVQCAGDKVSLFFTQANSSENLEADFPLPKPAPASQTGP